MRTCGRWAPSGLGWLKSRILGAFVPGAEGGLLPASGAWPPASGGAWAGVVSMCRGMTEGSGPRAAAGIDSAAFAAGAVTGGADGCLAGGGSWTAGGISTGGTGCCSDDISHSINPVCFGRFITGGQKTMQIENASSASLPGQRVRYSY